MDYIKANKEAWEESFDHRDSAWGLDIEEKVRSRSYAFFETETADRLRQMDLRGKTVAQFCCNNGRELLSLVSSGGAEAGYGFDIAENQVQFAGSQAHQTGINCVFTAIDILKIGPEFYNRFDLILITIGALCWFRELPPFFRKVSDCLKDGGMLLINEQHPLANMLAAPGEDNFDAENPATLKNSYFEKNWIETGGVGYMTKKIFTSKPLYSFSHPMCGIINAVTGAGFRIVELQEFDYDISGMFAGLNRRRIPLSFLLEAVK